MKIITLGDSWGFGSELKEGEIPFGQILADRGNIEHVNFAKPGMSLATIMFKLIQNKSVIRSDDVVLVVIPPDIRWYHLVDNEWKTITLDSPHLWNQHAGHFTIDWFIHHHNLFMYNIQSILKNIQCKFLLFHNYGELIIFPEYLELLDLNNFLSYESLTKLLSAEDYNNYDIEKSHDGPPLKLTGKYFQGNINHPNQLGHYRIAELINDKLRLYDTV